MLAPAHHESGFTPLDLPRELVDRGRRAGGRVNAPCGDDAVEERWDEDLAVAYDGDDVVVAAATAIIAFGPAIVASGLGFLQADAVVRPQAMGYTLDYLALLGLCDVVVWVRSLAV